MFEADLREGTIAAADRKEGYRVIEQIQREAYAAGANLSRAPTWSARACRASWRPRPTSATRS
jgi:hypothetical protein